MRKILIIFVAILILIMPIYVSAYSGPVLPQNSTEFVGSMDAKSAVLFDMKTGSILYDKDGEEKRPIASVTKVMTILLIAEAIEQEIISYDDVLTTSRTAYKAGQEGTSIFLEVGEEATVRELFAAVVIASANDAANVLAEAISGTVELFVAKMNTRAIELGMKNTSFLDPCGLNDKAYSTAYDIALMSRELINSHYDKIAEYLNTYLAYFKDDSNDRAEMLNTNRKFMRGYSYATGLKTGWTTLAGFCLTATAQKEDMHLNAVVLGCKNSSSRYQDVKNLLNYGFAQYKMNLVYQANAIVKDMKVLKGNKVNVNVITEKPIAVLLNQSQSSKDIEVIINLPDSLIAPLKVGQKVGSVVVKRNGIEVVNQPVICSENIKKASFLDIWKRIFNKWILHIKKQEAILRQ
ncbi:D-alanyl-D-alanine carboxypeptidase [Clostridium sp. 'deep sea']|uniref:D-alanyl-D-alanine carboxypeptidase family protein n=1 Tax=Clostridium sp. 'deep sea' TaxID=2779445 RepID=UPI0018966CF0|nr:D-alanyl-D-alanine carboxypeptidase family protein [Clostridium sp. 'deep sea']QOR35827.1 D-alanyl-D-alanine carboxypeptidase [Clostridium sp. 'deep sea']